jgi:hypothetical protein
MPTAVGHGLVGPEPSGNSRNWERPRSLDGQGATPSRTDVRGFGEWATGLNIPTHDGRGSCQLVHHGGASDESLRSIQARQTGRDPGQRDPLSGIFSA